MNNDYMNKENTLAFNEWLFKEHLAPNSSFLWFCYTDHIDDIWFLKLGELYDIFENGGDWRYYCALKNDELNSIAKQLQNLQP